MAKAKRTEITPNGLATYQSDDFRTYEPQWDSAGNGLEFLDQLCEEFIGGKWEGFISLRGARLNGQIISVGKAIQVRNFGSIGKER